MVTAQHAPVYVARKNLGFELDTLGSQVRFALSYGTFRRSEFLSPRSFQLPAGLFFADRQALTPFVRLLGQRASWLASGFQHELIIRGIGYRYRFHRHVGQSSLLFKLGYGHKVLFPLDSRVEFRNNRRYDFLISGLHKGLVRRVAEGIRLIKVTDAYKGKGVKYYQTPLRLKVGKVR